MWRLNDADAKYRGENCSLVACAALVSHAKGENITSGELLKQLWVDLANEIGRREGGKAEKTIADLNRTPSAEFPQTNNCLSPTSKLTSAYTTKKTYVISISTRMPSSAQTQLGSNLGWTLRTHLKAMKSKRSMI